MRMTKNKLIGLALIASICAMLLVTIQPIQANPNPQFIVAGWAYPDEYGQGIEEISIYENSTGAWQPANDGVPYYYSDNYVLNWNVSVAIKLYVHTWFNNTVIGADDITDGKNYLQHNVTVTQLNGTIVFSQQNFTLQAMNAGDDPMWFYNYYVVLNFLPVYGEIYTVTVTYELWW